MGIISVRVENRKGGLVVETIRMSDEETVDVLKEKIHDAKHRSGKYSLVRQRLTLPPKAGERSGKALDGSKTLAFYDIKSGDVIQHKDLGPQIDYKLVFFIEYLGPLLIYPYFWSATGRRQLHDLDTTTHRTVMAQDLACFYWSFHYLKRIFETFHVHTFSHATMPIFNLYRNSGYYWLFAAFVSYFINHPLYTPPPVPVTVACFVLAYLCQAGNFISHVTLANLRKNNTGYQIPEGHLFNYVTCANYTFEIWGWLFFAVATQSLPAAIFGFCGAAQMIQWALAKHKRLRKLFDGKDGQPKYPRRWVVLPPFL